MPEPSKTKSIFDKSRRAFLLRRLHSLTGAIPVGGFLLFHLWTNAKALQGQERFDAAVADINHTPYLRIVEFAVILLPLAFHAFYGVILAFEGKPNTGAYGYSRNWMYTLQRVSGMIAFLFIGFHLWEYWGRKLIGKMSTDQFYPVLCANMSATIKGVPVVALVYILGIAAAVFHFANGLWGFCFSWGITVSRRSQQLAATVFGLVGLVVFFLGANTAIYFATGSRLPFGSAGAAEAGARTCADMPPAAGSRGTDPGH